MKRAFCRGSEPTYGSERNSKRMVLPKPSRMALICFMSAGGSGVGGGLGWEIEPRYPPFLAFIAVQADEAFRKRHAFFLGIVFHTQKRPQVKLAALWRAAQGDCAP